MKMRRRFLGCALTFGLCAIGVVPLRAATGATVPSRTEVFRWLRQENYDQLEEAAGELRQEKLKFYSGHVKLSEFYGLFEIGRELEDQTWLDHLDRLEKWAKARPDSPTPLVALGRVYVSYGWKARGSGYGNTVTREGSRLFRERLSKARGFLESASKMPVKDVEACRQLIVVAMGLGQSKTEVDTMYSAGVEIEPNYLPLYEAKAYYLLPRWEGERGDWEAFANEAANARGDEEGDMLYMIIARSQAWTEGQDFFSRTQISYPRMKRGFEASMKRHPTYLYDFNSFCYFACIAGDKDTAKNLFEKIGGKWEVRVWHEQTRFQVWQTWAFNGGPVPQVYSRYGSGATVASSRRIKTVLIVGGVVWVFFLAAAGIGFWLLIRSGEKRS
jgi:hypothetical protein